MVFRKEDKSSALTTIKSVIKQLDNETWGVEPVTLAIAAHEEELNKQGKDFNCFVLSRPTIEKIQKGDELIEFLDHLKKNLTSFINPTTFQVVICNLDKKHWTPFEFSISNGKLTVLCFDAANDVSADSSLEIIMDQIPNCEAIRLEPDNISEQKKSIQRRIQFDNVSCSRMTIEHVFILSEANLIEKINKKNLPQDSQTKIKLIGPKDVISLAPALYRVAQDPDVIKSFGVQRLPASETGHTLEEYMLEHFDAKETKLQNRAIKQRRTDFVESITSFCENDNEKAKFVLDNRKNAWINFLNFDNSVRQHYILNKKTHLPLKQTLANHLGSLIKENKAIIDREEKRVERIKKEKPVSHASPEYHNFLMRAEETLKTRRTVLEQLKDVSIMVAKMPDDKQQLYMNKILSSSLHSEIKKSVEKIYHSYTKAHSQPAMSAAHLFAPKNETISSSSEIIEIIKESPNSSRSS